LTEVPVGEKLFFESDGRLVGGAALSPSSLWRYYKKDEKRLSITDDTRLAELFGREVLGLQCPFMLRFLLENWTFI
jgi:hypothetical protein